VIGIHDSDLFWVSTVRWPRPLVEGVRGVQKVLAKRKTQADNGMCMCVSVAAFRLEPAPLYLGFTLAGLLCVGLSHGLAVMAPSVSFHV
jgi:hypothetical protein